MKKIKRKLHQKEKFSPVINQIFKINFFFKKIKKHFGILSLLIIKYLKLKPVFLLKSIFLLNPLYPNTICLFRFIPKNKYIILGIPYCISVDVSTTGQSMTLDNFWWVVAGTPLSSFLYVVFFLKKNKPT